MANCSKLVGQLPKNDVCLTQCYKMVQKENVMYMAKLLKSYAIYIYIYIYTFSTKPDPCHYTTLLNADVINFLPNTGFITIRLLRFGVKVKRAYCGGNFLLRSHCQTLAGCLQTIFLCFNRTAPRRISTRHRRFHGGRQKCEKRVVV